MRFYRLIARALALSTSLLWIPVKLPAHGGDPDLIHACISKDGIIRIVGPNDECAQSETARHWIRVRQREKPRRDRDEFGTKSASLEFSPMSVP